MPTTTLDTGDAVELAELLGFVRDWLRSDSEPLAASLAEYVGVPGYDLGRLVGDLERFVFLLGADDSGPGFFDPLDPL
jgi:hypothetical protein